MFGPVTPGDLAAMIYRHFGIGLETTWLEPNGRPRPIVENGKPIEELFCASVQAGPGLLLLQYTAEAW